MYMGEHTNVTEKLHDIQKQGRTKGSLLDHIAIPVTAFFVATDLMTVHLYTESLFDERPEMAMLVAASIALLLDACPMLAGKLKGQLDDMLPRDQRATKRRISALLGTAVGAFAIFAGFCIVSTLISVEALGATENPTLYMVGQYIRMLLPIATSVGSYAIGFFSDHRSQLDSLKAQRLDLQDLAADTDSAISHAEFAAANFDPDLQDYRFAQAKLKSLSIAARQARLTARMKLAEELGIGVRECRFWQSLEHSYAERGFRVRLHFFHVTAFSGEPCPAEGQNLRWVTPAEAPELGFLPADAGVLEQLRAEGPPMA